MYFESHAHYDDSRYDHDRDSVLESLKGAGVSYVVNIGSSMASTKESLSLAQKHSFIFAAVGVHPHEAESMTEQDLLALKEYCGRDKVVAIGEIGLDYYYDHSPRELQRFWFKKQLALAEEANLPVVIHSRDAAEETFGILRESNVRQGVIHCYSGSREMALAYVKLGFYIGIGGVVTFPKAVNVVKTVEAVPIENILIETDSPYLAPVPKRGERNNSQNLSYICQKIAEIKQISNEEVEKITMENGLNCFHIK